MAYSIEALQEANLATKYNPLFWECACLSVNAGSDNTSMVEDYDIGDDDEEEDVTDTQSEEDESSDRSKQSGVDYGKISRAVSEAQYRGVKIAPPSVQTAETDFVPDVQNNSIIYSLTAVTSVNLDLYNRIVAGRPYTSLSDFISKVNPSTLQMINLIKAGSFDSLYPDINRAAIMEEYLNIYADQNVSCKEKLTMANFDKLVNMGALPQTHDFARRVMVFKKWVDANELDKTNKRYCIKSEASLKFFNKYFKMRLTLGKQYDIIPEGIAVKQSAFKKVCDDYCAEVKEWMNSEEGINTFYRAEFEFKKNELREKYCQGSVSKWEMQTVHYYGHDHELAHVNQAKYDISNFENLPEIPIPIGEKQNREGNTIPIYEVKTIIGTVINVDNMKHIVTLLTNFGTVVDVKFYSGQFINLYKTISVIEPNGKKRVIEKPWLQRGNLLLVNGFRRENSFVPRSDWAHGKRHSVRLITQVVGDDLILKDEREEIPEEYKKR